MSANELADALSAARTVVTKLDRAYREAATSEWDAAKDRTATYLGTMDEFRGDARLYRLSPPLLRDGKVMTTEEHVVVSAVVFADGLETYIFAADENGEITEWGELEGSFRGDLDHVRALKKAGYRVVHEPQTAQ